MERPLLWHQGLFLQPQHFQLADLYHQSNLAPLQKFLVPYLWGAARLEISQSSLATGTFVLESGEFVFPDSTYAVLPDNAMVETRKFEEAWEDGGKPLTVYLGLRRLNPLGANVTTPALKGGPTAVNTRFVSPPEPEEVRDLHESGPTAQVRRLKYALKILWETEKDFFGDYEVIPIAQLERQGQDVVLSTSFIPPSLTATPVLAKILKEIRDQISSRGFQLEGYKRDRGIHTAEFGSRDMVYLLALRSLNRYIPLLFHMAESPVHPWIAYGLLLQLIGELSGFSERVSVMGDTGEGSGEYLKYNHLALWQCFSRAQAVITALLDEITAGPEYVFALISDGTYYSAELPPVIFEGRNRFYLVVQTSADPKEVLGAIATGAKLSSRENLPILIVRALPGVGLQNLDRPPQELPRRPNALYFQVEHNSDQWQNVIKGHNIALFWDSAPEDLKAELMVVGKG